MATKKEGTVTESKPDAKTRKPKSPARWAVFWSEKDGGTWTIAADGATTERQAKEAAAKYEGAIMIVCVHASGVAKRVESTVVNWTK